MCNKKHLSIYKRVPGKSKYIKSKSVLWHITIKLSKGQDNAGIFEVAQKKLSLTKVNCWLCCNPNSVY